MQAQNGHILSSIQNKTERDADIQSPALAGNVLGPAESMTTKRSSRVGRLHHRVRRAGFNVNATEDGEIVELGTVPAAADADHARLERRVFDLGNRFVMDHHLDDCAAKL